MGVNYYDGRCSRCGTKVPANTGTYERGSGAQHPDGACKTTTKTYRRWASERALDDFREAVKALYAEAGYQRFSSPRVEYADLITGHGVRALVGGDRPGMVQGYGVRIYRTSGLETRESDLMHEGPRPRVETGDYYADRLAEVRELIATIDRFRQEAG